MRCNQCDGWVTSTTPEEHEEVSLSILVIMMWADIVGKPVRWIRRVIRHKKTEKEMSIVLEAHSKQMEAIMEMHRKQMEAICAWNADELDLTFQRYNVGLAMLFERLMEQSEAASVGISQEAAPKGPCSQRTEPQAMKDMPHLFPIKGGMLLDDCELDSRGLAWALREVDRHTDDEEELEQEAEQARQRAAHEEKMRIKQSLRHQVKQMPRHRKSNYKMNRTFFAPI